MPCLGGPLSTAIVRTTHPTRNYCGNGPFTTLLSIAHSLANSLHLSLEMTVAAAADAQPDTLTKVAEKLLALGVKPCSTLDELSALKPDEEAVRTKVTAGYVMQPRLV